MFILRGFLLEFIGKFHGKALNLSILASKKDNSYRKKKNSFEKEINKYKKLRPESDPMKKNVGKFKVWSTI